MLSMFPELFDLSFYVPFLLRVIIGMYLAKEGGMLFSSTETLPEKERLPHQIAGIFLFVDGILLVLGALLQPAALVAFSLGVIALVLKHKNSRLVPQTRGFYIIATAVAFSLILLGPGMWAIDLPL